MQYWVDGYNLIFRSSRFVGSLEGKRAELIRELNQYAQIAHVHIVVVFDAQSLSHSLDERLHYGDVEVVYATSKKTADEAILEGVSYVLQREKACVISSDKSLIRQARCLGATGLTFSAFLQRVHKRQQRCSTPIEVQESPKEIERLRKIFEDRLRMRDAID